MVTYMAPYSSLDALRGFALKQRRNWQCCFGWKLRWKGEVPQITACYVPRDYIDETGLTYSVIPVKSLSIKGEADADSPVMTTITIPLKAVQHVEELELFCGQTDITGQHASNLLSREDLPQKQAIDIK